LTIKSAAFGFRKEENLIDSACSAIVGRLKPSI